MKYTHRIRIGKTQLRIRYDFTEIIIEKYYKDGYLYGYYVDGVLLGDVLEVDSDYVAFEYWIERLNDVEEVEE